MQYTMTGRHLKITPGMKDAIEHKLNFLEKFLNDSSVVTVTATIVSPIEQKVEVLFAMHGEIIKAEATSKDFYVSLDEVVDKVKKQVTKKRDLEKSVRSLNPGYHEDKVEVEEPDKIVKRKKFSMKPMSEEEAILQMQLLKHNSFMFINTELGDVMCLLYKRHTGGYGIIEGILDDEE